jgi:hypothetical protein
MLSRAGILITALLAATACGDSPIDVSPLHARKVQIERELAGLRESVALLNRDGTIFPATDIAIAIDEDLVERLIAARLPYSQTVAPYTLVLDRVEVGFGGAPVVTLHGRVTRDGVVTLEAVASVLGALTELEIDAESSTLRATISVDHIEIEEAAGIDALVSGSALDELAARIRREVAGQLPTLSLPVRLQQEFVVPAITDGPVRLAAARLPVTARVSRVFAAQRRLWIGIHLATGEFSRP